MSKFPKALLSQLMTSSFKPLPKLSENPLLIVCIRSVIVASLSYSICNKYNHTKTLLYTRKQFLIFLPSLLPRNEDELCLFHTLTNPLIFSHITDLYFSIIPHLFFEFLNYLSDVFEKTLRQFYCTITS